MKRFLITLLAVCMIVSIASAELSDMTFDELLELRDSVTFEIMSRPEWKEVTVPGGTWIVGEDIPAGSYCISPGQRGGYVTIKRPGKTFSIISQGVRNESNMIGKIDLLDGDTVEIENGSVVFSPAIGLGF